MDPTIATAIIVLIGTVAMALISNHQLSRSQAMTAATAQQERIDLAAEKKADREADWERQDEVANRLVKQQTRAADAVEQVAVVAGQTATEQGRKLDQIHTLVNSNMTAAMEDSLAWAQALLLQLEKEVNPNVDAVSAIEALKSRIGTLQHDLADRKTAANHAAIDMASGAVKGG